MNGIPAKHGMAKGKIHWSFEKQQRSGLSHNKSNTTLTYFLYKKTASDSFATPLYSIHIQQ